MKIPTITSKITSHPLAKNSAIVFIGAMLTNVTSYLYHVAVGRILGPVGYGELAALISIFYILNAPSAVLQNIVVKFFSTLKAKHQDNQAKNLLLFITKFTFILEIVCFIVLIPFVGMMAKYLNITHVSYLVYLYFIFALSLLGILNVSVLQGYQKFVQMTAITNLSNGLRLIFGIIGAFFGVGWALIANIGSNLIGYLAAFVPLKGLLHLKPSKVTISAKSAFLYSVPTFLALLAVTALYSQDVVLVKHFFNAQTAGVYSSISVLGKIIFFASSSIGFVAFPMLAERKTLNKPYHSIVFSSLAVVAFISLGLTIGYFAFPLFIVKVLFGRAFLGAIPYLGAFGLFMSFYSLSNLFTTMYLALEKTSVWIFVIAAAVTQIITINLYHSTLSVVIRNNTLIVGGLFVALLLYYPYATRRR